MSEESTHSITQWLEALKVDVLCNDAAEKLVERLYPRAFRLVHRRLLSRDDAESVSVEAVHMLVTKTANGQFSIANRARLFALLGMIARGLAIDRVRMRARMKQLPNLTADGDESAIDETFKVWLTGEGPTLDLVDLCSQFERRLLAILDDRQWQVFRLHYYEDLKQLDIAAALKCSKETVSRVMAQIDHIIRSLLNQHELDELRDMDADERTKLLDSLDRLVDDLTRSVIHDWIKGLDPEQIQSRLEVVPHRVYAAMSFADNLVYVLRRPLVLSDLRKRVLSDTTGELRSKLLNETKTHLHDAINRWLNGATLDVLFANEALTVERVVESLRGIHEAARANRDLFE